ncbi:MAG: hypothetical protein KatS3mg081_0381 [Gemmatimonadales bacterium]|nr:MAG: hypothetical protein KatS3mg081_0381 [Gemmatimonadales bacterium]
MSGKERRWIAVAALALAALVLLPSDAHAWTPATHIFLGEAVLANLKLLPAAIAELLRAFPYDFLYGNIAADTSIAKKYAPVGRHCHAWHVGQEIYDEAKSDALRAFALGYLAHLAADTVAHNFFVPRQLVLTSRSVALGHSYWESRFDMYLGEHYAKTAVDVLRLDHSAADEHLDNILSPTLFSVRTSRRIFRGMVGLVETQSWQRAVRALEDVSRWPLNPDLVERHVAVSFDMIMDLLAAGGRARRLDPAGESSLRLAKRMRLDALRRKIPAQITRLAKLADEHFALPVYPLKFWEASEAHLPWRNGEAGSVTPSG